MYDRRVKGQTLTFGVSGKLYQSNVLFYDHQTESLWSQIKEEAVTGPLTGAHLQALPSMTTTWEGWHRTHPDTLVLSPETGYQRDYSRDPYTEYESSPEVLFPMKHVDGRLPPKERIFGLHIGNVTKAYPIARLAKAGHVEDQLGGQHIRIEYDSASQHVVAVAVDTKMQLPSVEAYWFAWSAFHPDTTLWQAE